MARVLFRVGPPARGLTWKKWHWRRALREETVGREWFAGGASPCDDLVSELRYRDDVCLLPGSARDLCLLDGSSWRLTGASKLAGYYQVCPVTASSGSSGILLAQQHTFRTWKRCSLVFLCDSTGRTHRFQLATSVRPKGRSTSRLARSRVVSIEG